MKAAKLPQKEGTMTIEQIVKLVVDNGVTLVVIGYFMYMNFKFNDSLTKTLTTISERLEILEEKVLKMRGDEDEDKQKRTKSD